MPTNKIIMMKKQVFLLMSALWLSGLTATAQVNIDSLEAVYDSLSPFYSVPTLCRPQ
jgi:hypothetical protein